MTITPLAPREPYWLAVPASFNTSIRATSLGAMSASAAAPAVLGTPSITIRGASSPGLPRMLRWPRMRIWYDPFDRAVTSSPGTPRSSSSTRLTRASVSLGTTAATAPVPGVVPCGGDDAARPHASPNATTSSQRQARVIVRSVAGILGEQAVPVHFINMDRHEIQLVVPFPCLNRVDHVPEIGRAHV